MADRKNVLKDKSFDFAVRTVRLSKILTEQKEYIMSKQLIRSVTGIGALVRETQNAESLKDFIHKLGIAQKECDETVYWLELLTATEHLAKEDFLNLSSEAAELLKILKRIIITSKQRLNKERNS